MSDIHIKRTHNLGLEDARTKVEKIAQSLKSELQADYEWEGDRLLFERTGASGTIDVGADYVDLEIKLGMVLALLKGPIEESVNNMLDSELS